MMNSPLVMLSGGGVGLDMVDNWVCLVELRILEYGTVMRI
jgi:hypothetical protein